MDVILLGTKGGPRVSAKDCGPGQVIISGDRTILIDAGQGVPQQLLRAGINPASITDILITHHHSDHNVSLGSVLMAAWAHGLNRTISVWGPPPLAQLAFHAVEANAYDIDIRIIDEGRPDLREMVSVTELHGTETDIPLGDLRLSTTTVEHAPVTPALAYRVDSPDGSVVVSGDTGPSENLIALAQNCDVLIHEVINTDLIEPAREGAVNSDWLKLREHLVSSHTDVTELGQIAARSQCGKLVLSHIVPAKTFPSSDWLGPIRAHFDGPVVLGRDLMRFTVGTGENQLPAP